MHGVNKGDRVSIYMPMIMESAIAMLACARIGAVHSIVVSLLDLRFAVDVLDTVWNMQKKKFIGAEELIN